jgi:hypothetical protein
MQARRLTAWCALALVLLCGCSENREENIKLRHELTELRQQLTRQTAERAAELAYYERQAGIAAACDWVVPLCPESITRPGKEAQGAGFGGGDDFLFWTIMLLKVLIAGTGVGAFSIALIVASDAFLRPSRVRTEAARKLVQQARADAQRLTSNAQRELLASDQAVRDAREQLSNLQAAIEETRNELARLEALLSRQQQNLNAVEEARRALDAI